jgi:apolipoprotein N-acyltransferase
MREGCRVSGLVLQKKAARGHSVNTARLREETGWRKKRDPDQKLVRPFLIPGIFATSILLTLSFPSPDVGILSLVALVPLLMAASDLKPPKAFLAGWSAGFIWFFICYNWVAHSISNYGGIPFPLDRAVIVLLAGVHALYTGFFGAIIPPWRRMTGFKALMLLPSAWVLLEVARSWIPAPFPWLILGSSFWRIPLLRPMYSIMGVYGVSFFIVTFNTALCLVLTGKHIGRKHLAVTFGVMVLLPVLGSVTARTVPSESIKVGIVQGNIEQSLKWEEELKDDTVNLYLGLTENAVRQGAELVVWPETAIPVFYQVEQEIAKILREYSAENGVHLIFGSPGYEMHDRKVRLFNRAYHIAPDGIEEYYDKIRLVPFGEYVPFSSLIPFIERMVPGEGEFERGRWEGPFSTPVPSGLLICYEASIPSLARREVKDGSRILINITNDAWFGRSWGPHQHLAVASIRAAENGVPLLRAANTGISAVIDPKGRVVRSLPLGSRDIIVTRIHTGGNGTFYSRFGDWIVLWSIAVITIIIYTDILIWRVKRWKGSIYSETP